jgi:lysine biosynthesis protein LysW
MVACSEPERLLVGAERLIREVPLDEANAQARTPIVTRCPECESDLDFDGYELEAGESINCPECSVELKVVSAEPIVVALAEP